MDVRQATCNIQRDLDDLRLRCNKGEQGMGLSGGCSPVSARAFGIRYKLDTASSHVLVQLLHSLCWLKCIMCWVTC
jgi:hypothetical protein